MTKHLAQVCGFDKWERCTNHGNRAYGITIVRTNENYKSFAQNALDHNRHASERSQLPYNRKNAKSSALFQQALQYNPQPSKLSPTKPPSPSKRNFKNPENPYKKRD